jgi:SAM-dependent methyltransferase
VELLERDEALAELHRQFERSATHGRLVVVSGEAGIGKTALVSRFLGESVPTPVVLWGACDPLHTPRPLGPIRDAARFRQGDAHRLSLPDASFDAAVANFLMPHLADHARAVAELTRVLADDGRVALSTWDHPERTPIPGALFLAVGQAGAPMAEGIPPGPPVFRYADDTAFAELLHDAGLVDVAVTNLAFTHRMPSADAFWDAMLDGTVRASAQVRGQTPDMQRSIRRAFDRIVADYHEGGGLELPVSVKIAAGRKPA